LSSTGHLLPEYGREDGADQTAGIDGSVEEREVGFHVFLQKIYLSIRAEKTKCTWNYTTIPLSS